MTSPATTGGWLLVHHAAGVLGGDGEGADGRATGHAEGHHARARPEQPERDGLARRSRPRAGRSGRSGGSGSWSASTKPVPEVVSTTVTDPVAAVARWAVSVDPLVVEDALSAACSAADSGGRACKARHLVVEVVDLDPEHHGHDDGGRRPPVAVRGRHPAASGGTAPTRTGLGVVRGRPAADRRAASGSGSSPRLEAGRQPVPRRWRRARRAGWRCRPTAVAGDSPPELASRPATSWCWATSIGAADAVLEVALDHRGRLRVDGVEGVGTEQLLDLVVAGLGWHSLTAPLPPAGRRARPG